MRITKVSWNDAETKVCIEYSKESPANNKLRDEFSLKCNEPPLESFKDSLKALVPYVVKDLELPDSYATTLKVRGVTFSFGGEFDTMGAVVTSLKTLRNSNAPLVLNTPHKTVEPYNEGGDESNCLSLGFCSALDDVIEEAIKYVQGNRAQQQLPLKNKEKPENQRGRETPQETLTLK